MKFETHGEVNAFYDAERSILFIEIHGPVNAQFFERYEKTVNPLRESINCKTWMSIVSIYGEDAILPLEAIPKAVDSLKVAKQKGLRATAVIYDSKVNNLVFRSFWDKLYLKCGVEHEFFEHKNEAIDWLGNLPSQP
jgi:hypothetical protein